MCYWCLSVSISFLFLCHGQPAAFDRSVLDPRSPLAMNNNFWALLFFFGKEKKPEKSASIENVANGV